MSRVPFTILTGWLGAGKTTALNRMLAASHGRKIAVLVNELGRIAIDTQLIIGRGNDVLELAGGCVCCKVDLKNDLWDGIGDIVARSAPDSVVLETTGIAEPAAILDGLVRVPAAVRDRIQPAGVICVVDAEAGGKALLERDEAREQVLAADRVLLAKLDVASPAAVVRCHAILDELAPDPATRPERASFPSDEAGARAMTAWIIERRPLRAWSEDRERPVHQHHPHRHGQLVAIAFSEPAPLVRDAVLAVIESLGDRLVRAKGFVQLAGDDRRHFLERAGIRTELRLAEPWPSTARVTELVLIGDDLDEGAVHRALWACRAGG
ncbi:MAG: GTP-binding protein [Kofleriaceae bacterium]